AKRLTSHLSHRLANEAWIREVESRWLGIRVLPVEITMSLSACGQWSTSLSAARPPKLGGFYIFSPESGRLSPAATPVLNAIARDSWRINKLLRPGVGCVCSQVLLC